MLLQRFVRGAGRGALKCLVPLLLLFMSRGVECLDQVDLVALIPGVADGSDDYFPLAPALSSAYRLAVEHINENGALLGSSILSVEVVESLPASAAAASLCKAIGNADKSTVAVRAQSRSTCNIFLQADCCCGCTSSCVVCICMHMYAYLA